MLKKFIAGVTLLCAATAANAASIEQQFDVASESTNFQSVIGFNLFDSIGGTRVLDSVSFSIDGFVSGSAEVESRDAQAATLVTTLEATLTLSSNLVADALVVTIPSVSNTFNATAFDGSLDFAGSSGVSYDDLGATQSESASYTDAAVLAAFTGLGQMNFDFDATATSSATGAGNIVSGFVSNAGGLITVIYNYTDVPAMNVSAPSSVALLGFGLLAFAGLRKSRK